MTTQIEPAAEEGCKIVNILEKNTIVFEHPVVGVEQILTLISIRRDKMKRSKASQIINKTQKRSDTAINRLTW